MHIRAQDSFAAFVKTFRLIGKAVLSVNIGLIVSVILAVAINPVMQQELLDFFK